MELAKFHNLLFRGQRQSSRSKLKIFHLHKFGNPTEVTFARNMTFDQIQDGGLCMCYFVCVWFFVDVCVGCFRPIFIALYKYS